MIGLEADHVNKGNFSFFKKDSKEIFFFHKSQHILHNYYSSHNNMSEGSCKIKQIQNNWGRWFLIICSIWMAFCEMQRPQNT